MGSAYKKKNLKWILTAIATLLGVLLILYLIPLEEIERAVERIPPRALLIALLLYALSYLFRSIRWKYYYPKAPFGGLFFTTAVNTFLNNLLPARLGELSVFALLRRYDPDFKTTLGKFLKVRLLDGFALLTLFTFAVVSVKVNLTAGLLMGALVYPAGVLVLKYILHLGKRIPLPKGWYEKIPTPRWEPVPFLLSVGALLSKLLAVYIVLEHLGLDFLRFTVGFLGGEISTIMPVHSVAGLGSYETSFSLALKLFLGEGFKEGFAVGFLSHAFLLLASALLGLLSLPIFIRLLR